MLSPAGSTLLADCAPMLLNKQIFEFVQDDLIRFVNNDLRDKKKIKLGFQFTRFFMFSISKKKVCIKENGVLN